MFIIAKRQEIQRDDVSSVILENTSKRDYLIRPDSFKSGKYMISKRMLSGKVGFKWYTRLGGFDLTKPELPVKIKEKMR